MSEDNKNKRERWRIVVFIVSLVFILFMWVKKDIASIYATMPKEQILPLVVTTIAVSLFKVAAIAGVLLLIRWIVGKFRKK